MYDHQAARSGHDLLKRTRQIIPLIFYCLLLLPSGMKAAPLQVDQATLDKTISEVLQKPVYVWRENGSFTVPEHIVKKTGIMHRFFTGVRKAVGKVLHRIAAVIKKIFKNGPKRESQTRPMLPFLYDPRFVIIVALLIIAVVIGCIVIKRQKKIKLEGEHMDAKPEKEGPGLAVISPSDHSPDHWETMAGQSLATGDARAAIRYFFLSTLSLLGEHRIISIRTSRSNREHRRELNRRFPDQEELNRSFSAVVTNFEYTWFGTLVPAAKLVERVMFSHRYIKDFIYTHG